MINTNGICHQCSRINEIFNPKQGQQEELMKLELVKASKKYNRGQLFSLRTLLVEAMDPLHATGTGFHDEIMNCIRTANGEKSDFVDRSPGKNRIIHVRRPTPLESLACCEKSEAEHPGF